MKPNRLFYLVLVTSAWVATVTSAPGAEPETLSLEAYLRQVASGNRGIQGALATSRGAELRAIEGDLLTAPKLLASAQLSNDRRETLAPAFQGTQTKINTYSLGVSQLTSFGLEAKLTYLLTSTAVEGASPGLVTQPSFFDARPMLELTQSLWRNGFGRETRASQTLLEAQALARSHEQAFQATVARADAEIAYWRLALARAVVRIQKDGLERSEKIRAVHERRARLDLSDRADLLQARAAVEARKLDFKAATDEEHVAARAFNTARGLDSDQVSEGLETIDGARFQALKIPERARFREDVLAAQQAERVAGASAELGQERNQPDLQLFANLSLNGRDAEAGESIGESVTGQLPWTVVGVRLTAPLDFGDAKRAREGFAAERVGAELTLQRRLFEQERQWNDLVRQFGEAKSRLELARSLETVQLEKLNYERQRHSRGRTTTFQVLTFEQDYANAQLAHTRAQADVLRLTAQMKTFGGNPQ